MVFTGALRFTPRAIPLERRLELKGVVSSPLLLLGGE